MAAAGAAALVLVLALSIKNNGIKAETEPVKNSTMVQENLQTEVETTSEEAETASILSTEEKSVANDKEVNQEQSVSEDEIKADINSFIKTYYNALGDQNKESLDRKDQASDKKTADDQDSGKTKKESQSSDKQSEGNKSVKKQTLDSKEADNEIIEKYQDIKTYIKPGLEKNSYVVFTRYNIKLFNIDTLVPGMSSMVINRDETGNLIINKEQDNKKLNDYINKLSKEKDIKKVINDVNAKLTKAVKKDTALQGFMDYLK